MFTYVLFKATILFAGEFTFSAIERIFSWVNPHVSFEATSHCAGVDTLCALERLFTRVCQHVLLEWAILCARVTALIALERFFTGMLPHVYFEISRNCGRIAALVATVELFPIMQSFLGIFICCQCFHLQGFSLMELAARLEDNWTQENYCHVETVCFESESYHIVKMSESRMSIGL